MAVTFHKRFLNTSTDKKFKKLSKSDFQLLGEMEVAYIKKINEDGFLIHSADGTPIGFSDNRDLAEIAARENDLMIVDLQ